jgi:UDP-glucose 4-epimerase
MQDTTVLVTGGAGYIGAHAVKALLDRGYRPIVLDNLVYGHREIVESVLQCPLIVGDTTDRPLLDRLFAEHKIDAVMHFAAYAYVGESVTDPGKYYQNNFVGTLTLLEAMRAARVDKFVFSSTCATYGVPTTIPIPETHSQAPINPYGASKLMVERVLQDYDAAYNFRSVIFRYFNAAGADPDGKIGENHDPETHLIPLILDAATGKRSTITVFGTNYPTPDGTCIRDYIHVNDLASAHILGLEYLLAGGNSEIFNLGNGSGFSVREVIACCETVTGKPIPVTYGDRRPGDPPILVGSATKARDLLRWNPLYADLETIVRHAWNWTRSNL